ncbi:MAG: hypothetical protein H7287_12010 [Thermoleophilia bacterium]|nr:hypothetical protein [Thermoleophilia bacterium]
MGNTSVYARLASSFSTAAVRVRAIAATHPVATALVAGSALTAAAAAGWLLLRGHDARTAPQTSTATIGAPATDGARALATKLGDLTTADVAAYGLTDDTGASMDTLKVIDRPGGGYLGVSHTTVDGVFQTRVSTSTDLKTWHMSAPLGQHASQPAIAVAPDGTFVVAWEHDSLGGNWMQVSQYRTEADLLAGRATRSYEARRTLGRNEGTPNIESVTADAQGRLTVELGMHYYHGLLGGVDRQAHATLTDFSDWHAEVATEANDAFAATGYGGNLGDRDRIDVDGTPYTLIEVQGKRGDFSTWGVDLVDREHDRITPLDVRTAGGSDSVANPTASRITMPDGRPGMVATYYVFSEGSAPGEAGEALAAWRDT